MEAEENPTTSVFLFLFTFPVLSLLPSLIVTVHTNRP